MQSVLAALINLRLPIVWRRLVNFLLPPILPFSISPCFAMSQPFISLILLALVVQCHATRVCERTFAVPHYGTAGNVTLNLTVFAACGVPGRFLPAAFIVNGALCRSASYTWLARSLARRGFAVAISDYTSRAVLDSYKSTIDKIDKSIEDGFDCPKNGTFSSVSSFHSMVRFIERKQLADVNHALVIGHSFGGLVATASLFRYCTPRNYGDKLCEYETITKALPYRATVLALYEGHRRNAFELLAVPAGTLFVNMGSSYSRYGIANISETKRAIDVTFDKGMNHYAVNNYAPAFKQARINCSDAFPGSDFAITESRQVANVRTIADILTLAYYTYRYGGEREIPGIAQQIQLFPFVKQVLV